MSPFPFKAFIEKLGRTQWNNILYLEMAKTILGNKLEKDGNYLENKKCREGNLSIFLQSQPACAYLEKEKGCVGVEF